MFSSSVKRNTLAFRLTVAGFCLTDPLIFAALYPAPCG
jgi:hypothetical protein